MALEILYTPQFTDNLEAILRYFDIRDGSNTYSRELFQTVHERIRLLTTMPEIGRLTDFPGVRILFVESYGIEYQIRDTVILIIDIFSCKTNPTKRRFRKK